MDTSWTDTRVERLKDLWLQGFSASQIAADLGGVSRNGVIGKVHRLGALPERSRAKESATRSATTKLARRKHRVVRIQPAGRGNYMTAKMADAFEIEPLRDLSPDAIPLTQRKTLLELRSHDCKWPYGDPATADFFFCGHPADDGQSYCDGHREIAYRPAKPSERYAERAPRSEDFRFGARKAVA